MRVAAVDLGTNTTRLLVADVGDGTVAALERREEITSLGEGVDARRRLLPLPIARVRNVLSEYRRRIEELGAERVLCVATSAVRDAENGEAFLGEIEWSYGFTTRLLTGEEEARLTFAGATLAADVNGVMVVDIGGGSTELVLADRAVSMDVGSVRLTEQFGEARVAMAEAVGKQLPDDLRPSRAIGVAGTIVSLAALDLGLERYHEHEADGHVLSGATAEGQVSALSRLSLEELQALQPLNPKRAPFIVAGPIILDEILHRYELAEIEVSVRDLLDGAALDAAKLPERGGRRSAAGRIRLLLAGAAGVVFDRSVRRDRDELNVPPAPGRLMPRRVADGHVHRRGNAIRPVHERRVPFCADPARDDQPTVDPAQLPVSVEDVVAEEGPVAVVVHRHRPHPVVRVDPAEARVDDRDLRVRDRVDDVVHLAAIGEAAEAIADERS